MGDYTPCVSLIRSALRNVFWDFFSLQNLYYCFINCVMVIILTFDSRLDGFRKETHYLGRVNRRKR